MFRLHFLPGAELVSRISHSVNLRLRPHRETVLFILVGILVGGGLSIAAIRLQPEDRLIIGNAAGTLVTLIEVEDQRILVGAGPSRSHSAELIGRTTRPWDRDTNLLILPGWDDHHVTGALGLLERESVRGIAVVGLPGEAAAWTHLEREAQAQGVDLVYVDRTARLPVSNKADVFLSGVAGDDDGAWIRLEIGGKRVDILDTYDGQYARPDPSTLDSEDAHVLVTSRGYSAPTINEPDLLVLQTPHWHGDFEAATETHSAMIDRNEHLTITMSNQGFTVPLDDVLIQR